jgi:hypothetical protein
MVTACSVGLIDALAIHFMVAARLTPPFVAIAILCIVATQKILSADGEEDL